MHYGNNPNSIFARTIGNRHPLCHSDDMRAHHILRHLRRHDISRRCVCRTSPRRPRPAHGWPRHRLAPQPQPRLDPPPHPATPSPSPPQCRPTAIGSHQHGPPPTPAGSHTTLPLLIDTNLLKWEYTTTPESIRPRRRCVYPIDIYYFLRRLP